MASTKNSLGWKILGGIFLVFVAAVIILPNVLRSKGTFCPITGASTVRTINTAQVTYATNYEKIGYAPRLAALEPAGTEECGPEHACMLDAKLACTGNSGQGWCEYEGYRFNIQTSSSEPTYKDYWVTATPIEANPKLKNYCSADDAVIHIESAAPLKRPYTRAECLAVPPDRNGYRP